VLTTNQKGALAEIKIAACAVELGLVSRDHSTMNATT
jgi:hypothetical protein